MTTGVCQQPCLEFQVHRNAGLTCTCLWPLWGFSYKNKPAELCSTRRMSSRSSVQCLNSRLSVHPEFTFQPCCISLWCAGRVWRFWCAPIQLHLLYRCCKQSIVEKCEFCLFSDTCSLLYLFVSSVCMNFQTAVVFSHLKTFSTDLLPF